MSIATPRFGPALKALARFIAGLTVGTVDRRTIDAHTLRDIGLSRLAVDFAD